MKVEQFYMRHCDKIKNVCTCIYIYIFIILTCQIINAFTLIEKFEVLSILFHFNFKKKLEVNLYIYPMTLHCKSNLEYMISN